VLFLLNRYDTIRVNFLNALITAVGISHHADQQQLQYRLRAQLEVVNSALILMNAINQKRPKVHHDLRFNRVPLFYRNTSHAACFSVSQWDVL
jgi:hypothetical protein